LHGQNIFRFDPVRILGKISLAYYNEFDYAKAKEWGQEYAIVIKINMEAE
jgi:hypothetical protein